MHSKGKWGEIWFHIHSNLCVCVSLLYSLEFSGAIAGGLYRERGSGWSYSTALCQTWVFLFCVLSFHSQARHYIWSRDELNRRPSILSLCSTLFSLMVFIQRSHWFELSGYCNPVLYALGKPGQELSLYRHLSSRTVNVNTFTYEIHSCLIVLHLFILFSGISGKTNCIFFHMLVCLPDNYFFKKTSWWVICFIKWI